MGSRRVAFDVIPDGAFHTDEVNLAADPLIRGSIGGLRFDPVGFGVEGEVEKIEFRSWKEK